jgi:hypothetical protein
VGVWRVCVVLVWCAGVVGRKQTCAGLGGV